MASDDDFSESDAGEQMDWEIAVGEFNGDAYDSVYEVCSVDNDFEFSEYELIEKLKHILELVPPGGLHQRQAVLHNSIYFGRSFDFCKLLIDHSPDLVKTLDNDGLLPIHDACRGENNHNELIKFLIAQYPESVNIPDANNWYPVHIYIDPGRVFCLDVLQLLLKCDEKALSTPNDMGDLPLHSAVEQNQFVDVVEAVYDAFPQALFMKNRRGDTPLDIARRPSGNEFLGYHYLDRRRETVIFVRNQLRLVIQAKQNTTPTENGRLPIHRALLSRNASIGTIKLMVAANPTSISVADNKGMIPLHIASRTGGLPVINEGKMPLQPESQTVDLRIVKFLVEANKASLNISDSKGNFALHHACAEGNCDVVNFILSQSTHGVSIPNTDGKLPIELFFYEVSSIFFDKRGIRLKRAVRHGQNYREAKEYIEAVYHLLRVHPDALKDLAE